MGVLRTVIALNKFLEKRRCNDGASHFKGLNNRVNYMLFHRKSVQRYKNILICAIFFVLLYSIF